MRKTCSCPLLDCQKSQSLSLEQSSLNSATVQFGWALCVRLTGSAEVCGMSSHLQTAKVQNYFLIMKRCSAYKYQRVSFRFQATLSRLQSKTKKKKRTISCEELFSFNYFGVKEKSIFYKCKLDIEVRVYCSKQVMRANAFSRKPPTDFKRNSASLIRRLNYELCARKTQVHSMPMFTALSRRDITKS